MVVSTDQAPSKNGNKKKEFMSTELSAFEVEQQAVQKLIESKSRMEAELGKVIIGQKEVTEQLLISLFAGGHCLLT